MMESLKPYTEYKKPSSAWFDQIPAHWSIRRLGAVLRERFETNEHLLVSEVLSVLKDVGVIPYAEKGNIGNKKSEDIRRYKIVRPDDIVLNSMNVIIGSVGLSRYEGCLSPVYYVLTHRSSEDEPRYLGKLFQVKSFQRSLVRIGNGILAHRMRIPMELLKCEPLPLPPTEEQTAIVRYLDWANARLERAIRAKRKIVALLNEQKQAIIHHAVTRGLDPNAPLRPSGIPLTGDIPAHWQTPRLGRTIRRIEQGWSPVAAEGAIADDQWAVLTLSSVRRGLFDPSAIKPISESSEIPRNVELQDGNLLLTRSNTRERVGDACVVRGVRPRTILCDLIYRLVLHEDSFVPEFLAYQLLAPICRFQIETDARGSSGTMPKISQGHIKSWRVVMPPKEEQVEICARIASEVAGIIDTISRTERKISLIQEYRTRLTADVVTGKLDVREAAARLPAEKPLEVAEDEIGEMDEEGEELAEESLASQ
jgi:type I restriction enzyme, S subunit